MTKEEAKEVLSQMKYPRKGSRSGFVISNVDIENEAIDLAISALEGIKYDEWCSDCKEYDHKKNCCPRFNRVIKGALDKSERKTGKWILQYPKGVWTNNYECSRCGGMVLSCEVDLPKYCGHCGAKMLKGEE